MGKLYTSEKSIKVIYCVFVFVTLLSYLSINMQTDVFSLNAYIAFVATIFAYSILFIELHFEEFNTRYLYISGVALVGILYILLFSPSSEATANQAFDIINRIANTILGQLAEGLPPIESRIIYLPQLIAVVVGKLLGFNLISQYYLCSLANLLTFLMTLVFALKVIPAGQSLIVAIAMLPAGVAMYSTPGSFCPIFCLILGFVALSLDLIKPCRTFKKSHLALLLIVGVFLVLSKSVFVFVLLLLFLIPKDRFQRILKIKHAKNAVLIGMGALLLISFLRVGGAFVPIESFSSFKKEIVALVLNPVGFINEYISTISHESVYLLLSFFNGDIPKFGEIVLMILFFVFFAFGENTPNNFNKNTKIICGASSLVIFLSIIFFSTTKSDFYYGSFTLVYVGHLFPCLLLLIPILSSRKLDFVGVSAKALYFILYSMSVYMVFSSTAGSF